MDSRFAQIARDAPGSVKHLRAAARAGVPVEAPDVGSRPCRTLASERYTAPRSYDGIMSWNTIITGAIDCTGNPCTLFSQLLRPLGLVTNRPGVLSCIRR